jgi:hypothetical protein
MFPRVSETLRLHRDIGDLYYIAIPILNLSEYANFLLSMIYDLTII